MKFLFEKYYSRFEFVGIWVAGFLDAKGHFFLGLFFLFAMLLIGTIYQARIKTPKIRVLDARKMNLPIELMEKMKAFDEEMKQHIAKQGLENIDLEVGKCNDPHCPDCWGLGDNNFKGHKRK